MTNSNVQTLRIAMWSLAAIDVLCAYAGWTVTRWIFLMLLVGCMILYQEIAPNFSWWKIVLCILAISAANATVMPSSYEVECRKIAEEHKMQANQVGMDEYVKDCVEGGKLFESLKLR